MGFKKLFHRSNNSLVRRVEIDIKVPWQEASARRHLNVSMPTVV